MSETKLDAEAVIDAMAPLIGIEIEPDYRSGIAFNLDVAARFAALVLEFRLSDHAEPAAVFRP